MQRLIEGLVYAAHTAFAKFLRYAVVPQAANGLRSDGYGFIRRLGSWLIVQTVLLENLKSVADNKDKKSMQQVWMTLAAFVLMAVSALAAAPIRVMILDGQSGGPYHDWRKTTPVLK